MKAGMEDSAHRVILALGTNINHVSNMNHAISCLQELLYDMICTRGLWTDPIGVKSDRFLNILVSGNCRLGIIALHDAVKNIEHECGSDAKERKTGIIRMDIDILKYDERKEHTGDWNREYIRLLMKEL